MYRRDFVKSGSAIAAAAAPFHQVAGKKPARQPGNPNRQISSAVYSKGAKSFIQAPLTGNSNSRSDTLNTTSNGKT